MFIPFLLLVMFIIDTSGSSDQPISPRIYTVAVHK